MKKDKKILSFGYRHSELMNIVTGNIYDGANSLNCIIKANSLGVRQAIFPTFQSWHC